MLKAHYALKTEVFYSNLHFTILATLRCDTHRCSRRAVAENWKAIEVERTVQEIQSYKARVQVLQVLVVESALKGD